VTQRCPHSRPGVRPTDRDKKNFSDGEGLTPLQGMELSEVDDFDGMLARMVQQNKDSDSPLDDVTLSPFNQFVDLLEYTRLVETHRTGQLCIFTLGGGAPRNWAQQVAPTLDLMKLYGLNVHTPRFSRGVRICPDEGGRFAEVLADATLVLPLLVKGVLQRLEKKGWQPPATP